jgi:hypothetical protein
VVPRAYAYLNILNVKSDFPHVSKFSKKFTVCLDEVLRGLEEVE